MFQALLSARLLIGTALADMNDMARALLGKDDVDEERPYGATVEDAVRLLILAGALWPEEARESAAAIAAAGLDRVAAAIRAATR